MRPPEDAGSRGNEDSKPLHQVTSSQDILAKYGGLSRISSIVSQIFKVIAAVESGKMTQEEGYGLLKKSGIGDKELTELITLVEEAQK